MSDSRLWRCSITEDKISKKENKKGSCWKTILSHYEKRNASLERRQAALMERVRFMECALPTLLMQAVVANKCPPETKNCKNFILIKKN